MALTVAQTLDMLGDLGAGDIDDVFSQVELQRFYDRAGDDYNTAVYLGWLQTLGNSAKWIDYRVAQTEIKRGDAFAHLEKMVGIWEKLANTGANQLSIVGMRPVPTSYKPRPADDKDYPRRPQRWSRWGW